MTDPARVEANIVKPESKKSNILQFVPRDEQAFVENVANKAQEAAGHTFTKEQATPTAAQPIPPSPELEKVEAIRIGAEPMGDITHADIKHHLSAMGSLVGIEEPGTHNRATPNPKFFSLVKERARRLVKKAA